LLSLLAIIPLNTVTLSTVTLAQTCSVAARVSVIRPSELIENAGVAVTSTTGGGSVAVDTVIVPAVAGDVTVGNKPTPDPDVDATDDASGAGRRPTKKYHPTPTTPTTSNNPIARMGHRGNRDGLGGTKGVMEEGGEDEADDLTTRGLGGDFVAETNAPPRASAS
jgi:hypothetical protein